MMTLFNVQPTSQTSMSDAGWMSLLGETREEFKMGFQSRVILEHLALEQN
jgi:hypothetical protein